MSGRLRFRLNRPCLPYDFLWRRRRLGIPLTRFVLSVSVKRQRMILFERLGFRLCTSDYAWCGVALGSAFRKYAWRRTFLISTSRFGTGQQRGSNRTPLGLHRIAEKIGGGYPIGTAFRGRLPIGFTWQGLPYAPIAHRILWLEGLEPGWNRGGEVDSHARYVYIHGLGDEPTLGRPASRGCIHMAASDLLPLFDLLPGGTLVWIGE
jgi:hypothetical protein